MSVATPVLDLGFTHFELAASGEVSSTKCCEPSNAVWVDDHNPGVTDSPV
jgi:hypothetical protein